MGKFFDPLSLCAIILFLLQRISMLDVPVNKCLNYWKFIKIGIQGRVILKKLKFVIDLKFLLIYLQNEEKFIKISQTFFYSLLKLKTGHMLPFTNLQNLNFTSKF